MAHTESSPDFLNHKRLTISHPQLIYEKADKGGQFLYIIYVYTYT